MNKKEVHVRRKVEKNHLPTKIMNDSKKAVASVYKDKQPLGILDQDLEKQLLTEYLRIDENDNEYGEKRDDFWKNFRLVVPTSGVVLDIEHTTDDNGDFEWASNLEDFITFKWLENHPLVADSEQEMKSTPRKEFYIYDPVRQTQKDNIKVQKKKEAYIGLAELAENEEKMDILVRLLCEVNPDKLSKEAKENKLDEYIDKNPNKFVKYAEDPDLEVRAEIEQMVDAGIIRKQGNSYLYMDKTIGDSIAEAINFFKNERNSELVLDLKSKLKDIS